MPHPSSEGIVRCGGVTKSFGTGEAAVAALRGIDLDVCDGELLLLVGPSGCSKTTLLSIIGAMLERDGGECEVMGRDPEDMSPGAAVLGVGVAVFAAMQGERGGQGSSSTADKAQQPPLSQLQAPFEPHVAGTGVVKAGTGNIAVGRPVSGILRR